jgi:hypothetical protein
LKRDWEKEKIGARPKKIIKGKIKKPYRRRKKFEGRKLIG